MDLATLELLQRLDRNVQFIANELINAKEKAEKKK